MKTRILRLTALICAFLLLLALPAFAARGFSDVSPEDWFYPFVTWLAEHSVIDGFEDGSFRPREYLTNAQFIKMLLAPELPEPEEAGEGTPWWQPYGDYGEEIGFLTEEDLRRMDEPVDRLRAARLLARLPLLPEVEGFTVTPDRERILAGIGDFEEIPEEGREAVITVYAAGLLKGYDDGCFHGENLLTRAESAALMLRYLVPETRKTLLCYTLEADPLENALLLGNSHCGGLSMYGEVPQADICFAYGSSVFTGVSTLCRDRNERSFRMDSCLSQKAYSNIVLIYGTNEMGYDPEYLRPYFQRFLDAVAALQPEAKLWICTAPPVNPTLAGEDCFTAENCMAVNALLRELAEERDLGLLDVWALFADEEGCLPSACTGDGIHLTRECYRRWGEWLPLAMALGPEGTEGQ